MASSALWNASKPTLPAPLTLASPAYIRKSRDTVSNTRYTAPDEERSELRPQHQQLRCLCVEGGGGRLAHLFQQLHNLCLGSGHAERVQLLRNRADAAVAVTIAAASKKQLACARGVCAVHRGETLLDAACTPSRVARPR
jgi:hypothetical protein